MIKIDNLIPLLKPGFVAMDRDGYWHWYEYCPSANYKTGEWDIHPSMVAIIWSCFDIAPFDGDWKDSLIKIKAKEDISDPTNTKDVK